MLHGALHDDARYIGLLAQNKYYIAPAIKVASNPNPSKSLQLSQSGLNAFSEQETSTLQDFVKKHKDEIKFVYNFNA